METVKITIDSYLDDYKLHLLPIVRPDWCKKELAVKIFDVGRTNILMAIYLKEKGLMKSRDEVVLLRVNGTGSEKLVDRVDEIHFMLAMHAVGLGPPVYAQLQNGLCYGFTPGHGMRLAEAREEDIWRKIAELMATLHVVTIPEHFQNRKPQLWAKVRREKEKQERKAGGKYVCVCVCVLGGGKGWKGISREMCIRRGKV